jgi:predicted homoserine dehydrogenase-like protein
MLAPYDLSLTRREAEQRPIRVALIGAGNLARMISLQLANPAPVGIRLVAIANRTGSRASALIREIGGEPFEISAAKTLNAPPDGRIGFSDDVLAVVRNEAVDVIVDATGTVDFSLAVVLHAIAHGKHVVLANAELDSTLGPALKARADQAGVVYTNIDGDEPGVAMNLVRYARSLGLRAVAAGNLKGMIDRFRNPDTQAGFAREHGQNPRIVTSFADGTKLSMEAAILANATGFRVSQPGMLGPACKHVREIAGLLPSAEMLAHGLIDFALGAEPHTGAFVVVHEPLPARRRWLRYLKMGEGPFYVLYTPYHLPHIQAIASIARAMDSRDATVAPAGPNPVCQVVSRAKKDLAAGALLDGPGGFAAYGQIENFDPSPLPQQGLPVALSAGCTLLRPVARDERIAVADVNFPAASAAVKMWREMLATASK